MRHIGITCFPDLNGFDETCKYIEKAQKLGYTKVFTQLQLLSIKDKNILNMFTKLSNFCKDLKMNVSADINPKIFKDLRATSKNLSPIFKIGLDNIRLDFGFSVQEFAVMSNNPYNIKLEVNASCMGEAFIKDFLNVGGNIDNLLACHNYYPRPETGLSMEDFIRSSSIFKKYNIKVGAFISSQHALPSFFTKGHGFPTIEKHRYISPSQAAEEIFATDTTDYILFGDITDSDEELKKVADVANRNCPAIHVNFYKNVPDNIKDIIINTSHLSRPDQAEYSIRSTEIRGKYNIEAFNNVNRNKYRLTIDNNNYERYCAEIQIILKDLPADNKVNVIGEVDEDDIPLLPYIKYGKPFVIIEKD